VCIIERHFSRLNCSVTCNLGRQVVETGETPPNVLFRTDVYLTRKEKRRKHPEKWNGSGEPHPLVIGSILGPGSILVLKFFLLPIPGELLTGQQQKVENAMLDPLKLELDALPCASGCRVLPQKVVARADAQHLDEEAISPISLQIGKVSMPE